MTDHGLDNSFSSKGPGAEHRPVTFRYLDIRIGPVCHKRCDKIKSNRETQRQTLSPGCPHTFTSLPLAVIGISGTLEPRNPVGLQGVFTRTGPLIRRLV